MIRENEPGALMGSVSYTEEDILIQSSLILISDFVICFFPHREKKIEGLNFIRCLAAFHSEILNTKLHETNFAVVQEVNLFSTELRIV